MDKPTAENLLSIAQRLDATSDEIMDHGWKEAARAICDETRLIRETVTGNMEE